MSESPFPKRKRLTVDLLTQTPNYVGVNSTSEITSDKIKQLDALINELSFTNKKLQAELQAQQSTQKVTVADQNATIKQLNLEITKLKARAVFHKEKYDESTEVLAAMKAKHNEDMNTLRVTMEKQRNELSVVKMHLKDESLKSDEYKNKLILVNSAHQHEIEQLKYDINNLTNMNEEKSNRIEEAFKRELELTEEINGLKSQVLRLQSRQPQSNDYDTLVEENKSVTKRLFELESANESLSRDLKRSKTITQNVELLRVEKDSLKSRVRELEKVKETHYKLEMENANMKAERNAWASYLDNSNSLNFQSPESIIQNLAHQAEKAKQIDFIKEQYQTQLEDQQRVIAELEAHMEELKKSAIENEQLRDVDGSSRKMLNDSINLLKNHIRILENQLTMYDLEEQTVNETYDAIKTQRITELQELLNQRESEIIAKNQELADLTSKIVPVVHISNGPYDKLAAGARLTEIITQIVGKEQEQVQELQEKITNEAILQKRCKAANELIEQLRESLATHQNMVPEVPVASTPTIEHQETQTLIQKNDATDIGIQTEPTVRILQLRDNPASNDYAIRKTQLVRLEQENKELVTRLNANNTLDTVQVPQVTLDNLYARANELQDTIKARDKRIQRLQTIFDSKIKETIEQIRRLLGFYVVFRTDDLIRLDSIFIDPAELSFMVKSKDDNPESAMLRINGSKRNEYMDQWQDLYMMHIVEDKNIPAFLNSVQTELYVNYRAQQREDEEDEGDMYMSDDEPYDEDTRIHLDQREDADVYMVDEDVTLVYDQDHHEDYVMVENDRQVVDENQVEQVYDVEDQNKVTEEEEYDEGEPELMEEDQEVEHEQVQYEDEHQKSDHEEEENNHEEQVLELIEQDENDHKEEEVLDLIEEDQDEDLQEQDENEESELQVDELGEDEHREDEYIQVTHDEVEHQEIGNENDENQEEEHKEVDLIEQENVEHIQDDHVDVEQQEVEHKEIEQEEGEDELIDYEADEQEHKQVENDGEGEHVVLESEQVVLESVQLELEQSAPEEERKDEQVVSAEVEVEIQEGKPIEGEVVLEGQHEEAEDDRMVDELVDQDIEEAQEDAENQDSEAEYDHEGQHDHESGNDEEGHYHDESGDENEGQYDDESGDEDDGQYVHVSGAVESTNEEIDGHYYDEEEDDTSMLEEEEDEYSDSNTEGREPVHNNADDPVEILDSDDEE